MLLAFLIAISAWALSLFLPWWSMIAPCLILGGWLGKQKSTSFLYGFLGIGILWLIQTLSIHLSNDGILTSRIAELFSLPHPAFVIAISVFIGGLAGGLGTLTGFLFREAFLNHSGSIQD